MDSVHSHLAWIRAIEEKLGVRIPFPIIADLDRRVSRAYGMLHPNTSGTAAVRAVFLDVWPADDSVKLTNWYLATMLGTPA